MTGTSPDRIAGRSLESFAREIDDVAAAHGTTRAGILSSLIAGLEERIAEDTAILSLARRLEADDRKPAETAFEHAIDLVARGDGQRPWPGKGKIAPATTGPTRSRIPDKNPEKH